MRPWAWEVTPVNLYAWFYGGIRFLAFVLAPIVLPLMAVAILVNVFQVGFQISGKALQPKLTALNPLNGIKKLFSLNCWRKSLG